MKYELPKEIRDGILQYLMTRPYNEVVAGIQALSSLKQIDEPTKDVATE